MRRMDMEPGVLYAIKLHSYSNPQPGVVHNPTEPGDKLRVRVWWSWPDYTDHFLNPNPDITAPTAKHEDGAVKTGAILMRWDVYCNRELAERAARLQAHLDAEREAAEAKAAYVNEWTERIEALRPLIDGGQYSNWWNADSLLVELKGERFTQYRYSARDIVEALEHATLASKP